MPKTIQSRSLAYVSNEKNNKPALSETANSSKHDAEDNFELLISIANSLERLSILLDKLDKETEKHSYLMQI